MDLRSRDDGDDDDGACVHERTALIGLGEFAATATTETETEADINNLADNGVLAFIEHVIWPLFDKLTIESTHKEYTEYGNLVMDFTNGVLSGEDLKSSTAFYINKLLDPIRKEFQQDELKALTKKAYPLQ